MKFSGRLFALLEYVSPSVWRVWIEIEVAKTIADRVNVTLRVEGVD